jgi:short subunit fatty acids transporter
MSSEAQSAAGIVIQFPFYAGIMGMMVESGLAKSLSEWFVSFSTADTLPLFTFWSAGLLNILIPSGGGQWAVQSQVMLPAAAGPGDRGAEGEGRDGLLLDCADRDRGGGLGRVAMVLRGICP